MRKVLVPIILISFIMILVSCATYPPSTPEPQTIQATGNGAPPLNIANPAQARLMAQRAAQADAYRNLAERIRGVRIEGETTVQDFMTKNDRIRTRVDALIRGATVISSKELPDKTFKVVVEIRIADIRAACKGY